MLSTCCTRLLNSRSRLSQPIERHTTHDKHKTRKPVLAWSCLHAITSWELLDMSCCHANLSLTFASACWLLAFCFAKKIIKTLSVQPHWYMMAISYKKGYVVRDVFIRDLQNSMKAAQWIALDFDNLQSSIVNSLGAQCINVEGACNRVLYAYWRTKDGQLKVGESYVVVRAQYELTYSKYMCYESTHVVYPL